MKKVRILNVIALILNVLILGLVGWAIYLTSSILHALVYFTFISNALAGVAALLCIICNIRAIATGKKTPAAIHIMHLTTVVMLTITMATVVGFLGPVAGYGNDVLYNNFSLMGNNFYMHLVIPSLSILAFIFTANASKSKWWHCAFVTIVPALYGTFYLLNSQFQWVKVVGGDQVTYDWYQFVAIAGLWGAVGIFAGMLVVGFGIALLFWLINRGLNNAYFKPLAEPYTASSSYTSSLKEEKEEKPVEEAPEEESAPEEEPVVEAAVVEEEKPQLKEEPKPAKKEEKPAPKKEAKPEPKKEAKPAKKEEAPKKAEPKKAEEKPAKKEEKPAPKKAEPKPAAKKAEPKKAEAKPAKKEEKPAPKKEAKPEPAKEGPTKVYHLTKRKEDGMWAITFVGGQKAVKLFKTKKEAEAALAVLTENQGATALIRNSKGAKAGKFASSIKTNK